MSVITFVGRAGANKKDSESPVQVIETTNSKFAVFSVFENFRGVSTPKVRDIKVFDTNKQLFDFVTKPGHIAKGSLLQLTIDESIFERTTSDGTVESVPSYILLKADYINTGAKPSDEQTTPSSDVTWSS